MPPDLGHTELMASTRGLERLLAFSDATVAIAITLLVLPLVEIARDVNEQPVGDLLDQNRFQLVSFALSFVVIAVFWRAHHSMYEDVDTVPQWLMQANFVWLASIVFLPFPTALLQSDQDQHLTHGIYIGTLVVASAAQSAQKWLILRQAGITATPVRIDLLSLALMVVALVIALLIPSIGLWALLILLAEAPVVRLLRAREQA